MTNLNIPTLQPNLTETQRFLRALAPSAQAFAFRVIDVKRENKKTKAPKNLFGSLEQHANALTLANQQGAGVYITINQTDGEGVKTQNITAARALFVDFDKQRHDRLADLTSLDIKFDGALLPSMVVESSAGKHLSLIHI